MSHPGWLLRGFQAAVKESEMSDFGFQGFQFTWARGRGTSRWVQVKLERVLVTGEWRDLFLMARAWSLEGSSSDHMPLLLVTNLMGMRRFRKMPHFENSWGEQSGMPLGGECGKETW